MTASALTLTPGSQAVPGVGVSGDEPVTGILDRTARPDYRRWLATSASAQGCSHPVRLIGEAHDVDPATGEVIRTLDTRQHPDGVLYVPCGTRRASVCPACAETYRRDTYQLLHAGLAGGKGIPATVAMHPCVFATFTAPSFGLVHTRRQGKAGRVLRCRPRRTPQPCLHGRDLRCRRIHEKDAACLGKPLCPDCYGYNHAAVWNAHASELWRRTTIMLRRILTRQVGTKIRLSYAKVAEFQARGVIHYHAIIRLDGHDLTAPEQITSPPPAIAAAKLCDAIRQAAAATWFATIAHPQQPGGWDISWGAQLDTRIIRSGASGEITDGKVAGYLAKYATKSTEPAGVTALRITPANLHYYGNPRTHHGRIIRACWELGNHDHEDYKALRRWAHMLGFRGHFATKSRRYSVTLGHLRNARATWQRRQYRTHGGELDRTSGSVTLSLLSYAGTGWVSTGDALLALSAAARAREHDRVARQEYVFGG